MADPFSILAATFGLADVCIRFISFLKTVKDDFHSTQNDLARLEIQISALNTTIEQVRVVYSMSIESVKTVDQQTALRHWQATSENLRGCKRVVEELEKLVTVVIGENTSHPKVDKFRRYRRLQSNDGNFTALQKELQTYYGFLNTNLTTANLLYTTDIASQIPILRDLRTDLAALRTAAETALEAPRQLTIASAESVLSIESLNEHFDPPRAVSSIFTGRSDELVTLNRAVFEESPSTAVKQKRFVVYGPPGSGKTEFCCKFASDNKQRFWAIFHVVANSRQQIAQDFAQIARYGKRDPNERAAKNWLSSVGRNRPWLLIIDNADTDGFPIEECYPDGDNGVILVTTRDARMRVQGTIGRRYFEFSGLDEERSCELLLTAADRWQDCSDSTRRAAQDICDRLGHLPLALTHAGKTILERAIRLEDYLTFFEENWAHIRSIRKNSHDEQKTFDANARIFASFEIIHESLYEKQNHDQAASDALDILRISSFLHHQRIRIDLLYLAAMNPSFEKQAHDQEAREAAEWELNLPRPATSWQQRLRSSLIGLMAKFAERWHRPALPRLLSKSSITGETSQVRHRVAEALKELYRWSLIFHSAEDETYSMHPAVHYWMRERPQMRIAERAVWCHVAATILARATLPPPLHNTEEQEIIRRDLLPHVTSVEYQEQETRKMFTEMRRQRSNLWPALSSRLDRDRAVLLFKFSLVYMQGGLLEKAKEMQQVVLNFVMARLGAENDRTVNLKRLLAGTLWMLNQQEATTSLRRDVLETSKRVRGDRHPETLKVMDEYGSSLWQQGRIVEALQCHTTAVEGFQRVFGEGHRDTLRAMGNLGRVLVRDWKFDEAVEIQSTARSGLQKQLGDTHPDTVEAMDNLAMAYFDRVAYGHGKPGDLDEAVKLESEVFTCRKQKLGREHVLTLWAGLNLARIKGLRGEIDEALAIFHAGHAIAVRNLGETHFAVLFGKTHYGRILIYAKRYAEAEKVLLDVIENSNTAHPDRLLALFSLIKCRKAMGVENVTELVEELLARTRSIFREDHPAVKYILDPRNQLVESGTGEQGRDNQERSSHVQAAEYSKDEQEMIVRYGHVAVGQVC